MDESSARAGTESADERTASAEEGLGTGLITISTDRSLDTDAAGERIETALAEAGHDIVTREHVVNDHDRVQSIVLRIIDREDVDLVITAGGTSIEPDDVTIEATEPLLEKHLSAFPELFTQLAYDAVGTRVVAARTLAGVAEGTPVFCLPGNADAAGLATEEIILPEATHLTTLAAVDEPDEEDE
ncbi:MogA/MoaB family molybdenum cofactor biosynthesis protein [Halopiger goleimassiliensis]|uniref:MogA/MoaB family molybdenum cofactor biosynthesis protein n=1 Tax=Halopiger goleimassiliensis TaxID=1293048 RepID=UPI000677AD1C|nr:molybdenum cofactor synthesis domain-containing protein [Halopiger goleimassiliensis]